MKRTGHQILCSACANSATEADSVSKYRSRTWEKRTRKERGDLGLSREFIFIPAAGDSA